MDPAGVEDMCLVDELDTPEALTDINSSYASSAADATAAADAAAQRRTRAAGSSGSSSSGRINSQSFSGGVGGYNSPGTWQVGLLHLAAGCVCMCGVLVHMVFAVCVCVCMWNPTPKP